VDSKPIGRTSTVLAVGVIAAVQSYSHIYSLALANLPASPARGLDALLLPLSVDGLIIAASQAMTKGDAPVLARWMLGLAVTATVGANVAYGLSAGILSGVLSAWPGICFAAADLLLRGRPVRKARARRRQRPASIPVRPPAVRPVVMPEDAEAVPPAVPAVMPEDTQAAPPAAPPAEPAGRIRMTLADRVASAQALFADDLAAGRVPGIGTIRRGVGGGQDTAYDVQRQLRKLAEAAA
jgi:hypothetical protein